MPGPLAPLDLTNVQIPYHFRCPISLELMTDPVTVSTGQTYDRSSIESWISTGNTTCPVTRSRLQDFSIIPNHTLRRLIQDWCVAHRSFGIERIPTPKQPADPNTVKALIAQSSSAAATAAFRLAALRKLKALSRESETNRALIGGSKREILAMVLEEKEEEVAVEAMAVVAVLALGEEESKAVVDRRDKLEWLGRLLKGGEGGDVRVSAAMMVEAVAAGTRLPENRVAIASTEGVVDGLAAMVKGNGPKAVAKAAIRALFSLCLVKQNRSKAIGCKTVEALVGKIGSGNLDRGDLERALATVELLCRLDDGCDAVVRMGGVAASALVNVMVGKASDRAAEHAVGSLYAVCSASEVIQKETVSAGVVPQLLLMVQGGCTERAKRKAQLLLKLLWSSAWAHHDSCANSDDFHAIQQLTLLKY